MTHDFRPGGMRLGADIEKINALVGEVYDAAMQPERWPSALARMGEFMGGAAFIMSALHRTEGIRLAVITGQDPAASQVLQKRYAVPATNPLVAAMAKLPVGVPVARHAVHPDRLYLNGDMYNEVFRPQGLKHQVIACLHRTEELVCPLGILRPAKAGHFSPQEMRLLELFAAHLRRAIQLSLQIQAADNSLRTATDALNRVAVPVFVADAHCRVVHVNAAAERLSREQDGLWVRQGEFVAWRTHQAAALRDAIGAAATSPHEAPGALRIERRSGKRPYVAIVAPLGGNSSAELTLAPTGCIVLVSDPVPARPDRGGLLRQLFKLTPRETQLAEALLDGKRLEHYAAEAGVSINTAKTQLGAIFGKTGTTRQAELIRLLNAVPAVEPR